MAMMNSDFKLLAELPFFHLQKSEYMAISLNK